jgi:CDP-diacylglycerol--serine O-phosphatidyltransferase
MFCGFMAIIDASSGEFIKAAWLIILAAGFDALDGVMARITKSSSEFGVEIDSLSDVISFGAAPAFLVYQVYLSQLGATGILLSSLPMVFGGLRLARFNTQLVGFDKDHFVGLPIPMSALTISSFILNFWREYTGLGTAASFLPFLVVLLSLLMVSKVTYDTLPKISRKAIEKEPWKYIFLALAVIVVFLTGAGVMLWLFLLFILIGLTRYLGNAARRMVRSGKRAREPEEPAPGSIDL